MVPPAHCRPKALEFFGQELTNVDTGAGLFRAAFAIALHERPEARIVDAESLVGNLAETVRRRARSNTPPAILAHLHDVLFEVFGLRGNTEDYYNPANSYLPDVLRTRQGIPISLVLVYKRVAESLGLIVYGINAPGHFLAEVQTGERRQDRSMFIDPFYGGEVLNEREVAVRIEQATGRPLQSGGPQLSRATHRQWLARMLNNLQAAFAATGRERDICAMQEFHSLL